MKITGWVDICDETLALEATLLGGVTGPNNSPGILLDELKTACDQFVSSVRAKSDTVIQELARHRFE